MIVTGVASTVRMSQSTGTTGYVGGWIATDRRCSPPAISRGVVLDHTDRRKRRIVVRVESIIFDLLSSFLFRSLCGPSSFPKPQSDQEEYHDTSDRHDDGDGDRTTRRKTMGV